MPPEATATRAGVEALSAAGSAPILRVADLRVAYGAGTGAPVPILGGVGFELSAGEALGVLGESGCGKSTLCLALLGLLPPGGGVTGGSVRFEGRELLELPEAGLQRLRGRRLAMIFQEPGLALNPCLRVGEQIADLPRIHRGWRRRRARAAVLELLARVRFTDPERVYRAYPHQLSGGQRQRVVIAQALVCEPALVVADEPTASLDAVTGRELVDLLRSLLRDLGTALLFVSHDPAVLAGLADRLAVMYAGRLVEVGERDRVLADPLHPYTRALLECAPAAGSGSVGRRRPLPTIPGSAPDPAELPPGCAFEPRCRERREECAERPPPLARRRGGRRVACVLYPEEGS